MVITEFGPVVSAPLLSGSFVMARHSAGHRERHAAFGGPDKPGHDEGEGPSLCCLSNPTPRANIATFETIDSSAPASSALRRPTVQSTAETRP
jgi:hypothetical protein